MQVIPTTLTLNRDHLVGFFAEIERDIRRTKEQQLTYRIAIESAKCNGQDITSLKALLKEEQANAKEFKEQLRWVIDRAHWMCLDPKELMAEAAAHI